MHFVAQRLRTSLSLKLLAGVLCAMILFFGTAALAPAAHAATSNSHSSAAPQATTNLARLFVDANFSGNSVVLTGTDGTCDASGYGFSNLGNFGFNDVVSSFQTFGNCHFLRAYKDINFRGTCQEYNATNADVSFVGTAMNDQISSIRLTSVSQPC